MTLDDLVSFLASRSLTLRSCQFAPNAESVSAFTCDPVATPEQVHVHMVDDAPAEEPDALGDFLSRRAKEPSQ